MRATLALVALVLPALLAGCAADEPEVQPLEVQTALLSGTVTTLALEPLGGIRVYVPNSPHEALTDSTGRFELRLPLGEYILLTDAPGYVNTAQRARLDGPDVQLAFQLRAVPTQAPSVRTFEAEGLVACGALVQNGDGHDDGSARRVDCGASDTNQRPYVDFVLDAEPGTSGIVIELTWKPTTDAGKRLLLRATQVNGGTEETVGEVEGDGYARVVVAPSVAALRLAAGGTLRVHAVPAGSFLDENSALDAGVVVEQPFTVYVTAFAHAPPAPDFSVLDG